VPATFDILISINRLLIEARMPTLTAFIGAWLALTAASGLASDPPAPFTPSDTAPLAPMLPMHPDSYAVAPVLAQEAMEGASSNLKRDLIQATGGVATVGQATMPPSQADQSFTPAQSPYPTSGVVQTSATEAIAPDTGTDISEVSIGYREGNRRSDEHQLTEHRFEEAGLNPLKVPLNGSGHATSAERTTPISALITVCSSLAIVLGLFFFVAWAMRKAAPRGSVILPNEVFEILGRASLGGRQQVQLVRCGTKLVLLSITPAATEPLTEVTDPLEVDRLAGICRQAHPRSSTKAFQQVFQQLAPRSGSPSPLDDLENLKGRRSKSYRWENEHV